MRRKSYLESQCPIARSLERVGEWWSILILREAFLGATRFEQFQKGLDIAPNMLTKRLAALVESTEAAGIWTIQSGVFPENTASLRLHQQAGFRVVGTRERIGRHHGEWRDVVLIERRSGAAGR